MYKPLSVPCIESRHYSSSCSPHSSEPLPARGFFAVRHPVPQGWRGSAELETERCQLLMDGVWLEGEEEEEEVGGVVLKLWQRYHNLKGNYIPC